MYIKLKYKCSCGCVSEFENNTSATCIACSNCGKKLTTDISDKVLLILRTMNEIPDNQDPFAAPELEFITDAWKDLL